MITLPQADDQGTHTLIRSFVSFCSEFSINAYYIVTAFFPSFTDEREVRIKLTSLFAPFALGKGSSLHPMVDRAVTHSHTLSNDLMAQLLLPQCHGLLVAYYPLCPMKLHDLHLQWKEMWGSLDLQHRRSFKKRLRLLFPIASQMVGKTAL